jgi:hypothetical protein
VLLANPDPKAIELLGVLRTVLGEHAVRTWLSSPSSWLAADAVPVELFATNPDHVITAARRFVSNAA